MPIHRISGVEWCCRCCRHVMCPIAAVQLWRPRRTGSLCVTSAVTEEFRHRQPACVFSDFHQMGSGTPGCETQAQDDTVFPLLLLPLSTSAELSWIDPKKLTMMSCSGFALIFDRDRFGAIWTAEALSHRAPPRWHQFSLAGRITHQTDLHPLQSSVSRSQLRVHNAQARTCSAVPRRAAGCGCRRGCQPQSR